MRTRTANRRSFAAVVSLAAAVAACSETGPAGPGTVPSAPGADRGIVATAPGQFGFYGTGGTTGAAARTACDTDAHDEFDFWVGDFDVFGPGGGQAGTNHIVNLLDNCLVEENWTGAGGGRGRSMNAYDAATDTWSQYWIDQFGTHLRLSGGLVDDQMVLSGPHLILTTNGLLPIVHRITWTPGAEGVVNQFWDASIDEGQTFPFVFFNGDYVPTDDLQPAPPLGVSFCTNPEYDELDFLLGSWRVESHAGRELGHTVFREDLENCLVEEDFRGSLGLAAQSFFGWDVTNGTWYQNYLDSEGRRIVLSGGVQNGGIVLSGERPRSGGKVLRVRVTVAPDGPDRVSYVWEETNAAGLWKEAGRVTLIRD